MTTKERLAQVDEAINAVMIGGQEYTHEGRRVVRAGLSALLQQRGQLEAQIAAEGGESTSVAVFEGR